MENRKAMRSNCHKSRRDMVSVLAVACLAACQASGQQTAPAAGTARSPVVAPVPEAPAPALSNVATVIGDRLNVRSGPDTRRETLGQLKRGDTVNVKMTAGEWLGIVPPAGVSVWVHQDFVRDGEVLGDRVNLRSGPSTSHTRVGLVVRGEKLAILETVDGWLRIEPPQGVTVWVHAGFVELPAGLRERLPSLSGAEEPAGTPQPAAPGATGAASPAVAGAPEPTPSVLPEQVVPAKVEPKVDQAVPIRDANIFTELPEGAAQGQSDFISHQVRPGSELAGAPAPIAPPPGLARLRWPTDEEFRRLGKAVAREGVLQRVKVEDGLEVHALVKTVGARTYPDCFLLSPTIELTQYEGQKVRAKGLELWAGRERSIVRVERVETAW